MKKIPHLFISAVISITLIGMPLAGFAQTAASSLKNALNQLRQTNQEFKDKKAQETNAASEESRAATQAARQAAQQKRVEAQKLKEEKRKDVLLKSVDIQIDWMTRTKDRVSKMPNIDASLKTQLNAEIDKDIQKLNEEKTKVQNATTAEAFKELAVEIRNQFKSFHEIVGRIVDAIHASQESQAVSKAEDRAAAIKAKIEELKAAGKSTSELEADLADAEKKIDDAREKVGQKAFQEANDDLKGAYQKFRGIADKANKLK